MQIVNDVGKSRRIPIAHTLIVSWISYFFGSIMWVLLRSKQQN